MSKQRQPPGCRDSAVASFFLVGVALAFMAIGLTLLNGSCQGGCEMLAVTMLFAGLPISALFGVAFGDLVVAWPLDMTLWVVIGFLLARRSDRSDRGVMTAVLAVVILALAYGLVLSMFVEIAI